MGHNFLPRSHVHPGRSNQHRDCVLRDERRRFRLAASSANTRDAPLVCGVWSAGYHAYAPPFRQREHRRSRRKRIAGCGRAAGASRLPAILPSAAIVSS